MQVEILIVLTKEARQKFRKYNEICIALHTAATTCKGNSEQANNDATQGRIQVSRPFVSSVFALFNARSSSTSELDRFLPFILPETQRKMMGSLQ